MKIERMTLPETKLLPSDVVRAGTKRPAGGGGVFDLGKHEEILPTVAPLLPRAIAWLEDHHGIVIHLATFRLTFAEKCRPAVLLPLFPVTGLYTVTRDGQLMDGWNVKNHHLWHPTAHFHKKEKSTLSAMVQCGFKGSIPHLILQALAIVCHHWLKPDQDEKSWRKAQIGVGQLLAVYRPHLSPEQREVAQWL